MKTEHVKTDRFRGDFRGHFRGHPRGTFRGDFRGDFREGLKQGSGGFRGRSRGGFRVPTRGPTRGPTHGVKFRGSRALCLSDQCAKQRGHSGLSNLRTVARERSQNFKVPKDPPVLKLLNSPGEEIRYVRNKVRYGDKKTLRRLLSEALFWESKN